MKRSALAGLFITAAMLASPAFAAGEPDLCKINLDKINNGKALLATDTSGKKGEIDTAVSQAKAAHAAGDDNIVDGLVGPLGQVAVADGDVL